MSTLLAPYEHCDLHLPDRRDGKVRTSFRLSDGQRLFVTTDRLSAFDRIIASVPYKGQVLNQLAAWWFETTRDIVANHAISMPDENALIGIEASPLPVEVVVRGIYGHTLPDGLVKNQALATPLVTPTTKAEQGGHDEAITCDEVVSRGLVAQPLWDHVQDVAVALFNRGVELAAKAGIVLADTKYEFGLGPDGQLLLIDEVHTPDSSRFWVASTLDERLAEGLEPESFDKEVVRRALDAVGFRGDGPVPDMPPEIWAQTSARYIDCYERLTGRTFVPGSYPVGPRLAENVKGLS
jgi:phosphoribosylaminoimidazole-succinocarboxamide synthase